MIKIIPMLLLWSSALTALAQGTVVVPNSLTSAEGNSSVNDFLNSSTFRMQIVFDASQFAIPAGASGRIDRIAFRIDGASSGDVLYAFQGSSIQFSTTARTPDGLSPVFAENIGSDVTTVSSESMTYGGDLQPGMTPQPFGQSSGTAPFWYRPSQGNLLMDIRGVGGLVLFPGALDAQLTSGDSVSRVFALNNLAAAGTADSLGLVTRFNFTIVPEPATWALGLSGLVLFTLVRRKR